MKLKIPKLGSTVNYGIAYTLSSGIQKGVGFFVFMYLASILSIEEYANFGLSYSVFTVIALFASAGIQESVVGLMNGKGDPNKMELLFKAANSVFVIFAVLIFFLFFLGLSVFARNGLWKFEDIIVIVGGAVLSSFFLFQSIIIRLEEKHILSILLSFFPAILGHLAGFWAVFYTKNAIGYFLGVLLGHALLIICFIFTKNIYKGVSLEKKAIKQIVSRVPPYAIISFWGWALGYGNTFIIKYLFEDYDVALFVFVYTISSIIQLVATSMNQVWSPRFFLNYSKDSLEVLEKKNARFTAVQGGVIGLFGLLILIVFPFSVKFFSKLSQFSNSTIEMILIFAAYVVSIPWWHCQNYFMINDKGKLLMNITVVSSIIGYIIWILAMVLLGPIGIYVGFFFQMLVRTIIVYVSARKIWNIRFDWTGILLGLLLLGCVSLMK